MKIICSVCLQSDFLCRACGNRLEKGEITKTDIDLARTIHKMKIKGEFLRAIDADKNIFVIASPESVPKIIGAGGRNVKKLSAELGKNIRVVEKGTERGMIEKILGVRVIGINIVYSAEETRKVRIHRKRIDVKEASHLLEKIFGKKYGIVLE